MVLTKNYMFKNIYENSVAIYVSDRDLSEVFVEWIDTLDIENAFNSVKWKHKLLMLVKREVSTYIVSRL